MNQNQLQRILDRVLETGALIAAVSRRRRLSPSRVLLAGLVAFILLTVPCLHAQTGNAQLSGTVLDPSGASVPGAAVSVISSDTGQKFSAVTTDAGTYTVLTLPPGHYSVTVTRDGFAPTTQNGLLLTVGQAATLNITLTVGGSSQTVTVNAQGSVINQTTAELSELVDQKSVEELPLNGRDPSSLVLLAPGTTNVLNASSSPSQAGILAAGNSMPTETGASVNGLRQGSVYYLLDGVQNMDTYLGLAAPFPNADATQEFRVITNNFDARYGFAPGAVVTIQTKSGANDWHGGAFEFLRNNALNAGNYFSHAVDTLKRNQFGGFLGGPAIKNKLFFFGNYQMTRASLAAGTNTVFTPTAAMLAGDFSAVPQTLNAPFATINGKPNQINPALFNPASLEFAQLMPQGQVPSSGQVNYAGAGQSYVYQEATGRLDWDLKTNQRLTLRSFVYYIDEPSQPLNGNILYYNLGQTGRLYNELLTHTWSVSPTSVNVASVAWLENDFFSAGPVTNKSGQPVCLSQYINISDPAGACYMEGGIQVTNGPSVPYTTANRENRRTITINDDFSKIIGQHTLTFGGNVLHQFAAETTFYPANATVTFNGQYTGFGIADYLLGYADNFRQGAGEAQDETGILLGLYAQDAWRVRPNLTITAGLRWEPNLPPTVPNGRGAAFIPGEQSSRYPNAPLNLVFPGDPGVDSSLMPHDYLQFGPRIGIAWQPHSLPKTAIHAAFGLFYNPMVYSSYNHTADISPFSPTYIFNGGPGPASPTQAPSGYIPFSNPYSYAGAGTGGVNPFPPFVSVAQNPPSTATFPSQLAVSTVFSHDFKLGTTQSWNVSIEQQLGNDMVFRLAYIGNQSYHQQLPLDLNPGIYVPPTPGNPPTPSPLSGQRTTYPNFSSVLQASSIGTSSYHALQAGFEKRLSHGLQVQSNLTWSRTEDTYSGNSLAFGATLPNPFNIRYNYGISDLDIPLISVTNLVYTTPKLEGKNRILRQAVGNWEISTIYTMQSGLPFGIVGGNGNNNSASLQAGDRADFTAGFNANSSFNVHRGGKQQWLNHYFNTAAFTENAPGTFGNTPRNMLHGPGINTGDVGLIKNWLYRERTQLQFRWEMFNAFNHSSFSNPNNDPSSGNFGQITTIGPIAPRVMQAALKLTF